MNRFLNSMMLTSCFVLCSQASAVEWKAPGNNIARGTVCVLDGDPSIKATRFGLTAGNDDRDLTDGNLVSPEMMWIDKGCVAWYGDTHTLTFDLGAVKPIAGVGYHTGARSASGVGWPPFILVLVSDDGKTYRVAGELIALSSKFGAAPDEGRFRNRVDEFNEKIGKNPLNRALLQAPEPAYWFRTDELATQGRYVQLVVQSSLVACSDEVEIYEGQGGPANGPVVEKAVEYAKANAMPYAMAARLATDAARALALVDKLKVKPEVRNQVAARLEQLRKQALQIEPKAYDRDFRAIVPLSPLHTEIFAALGDAYRAAGYPEYTLWRSNPWVRQSPFDLPTALVDGKPVDVKLDVFTLHNDRRGELINLGNFTGAGKTAVVSVEGLPGGAKPEYLRVRQVEYIAMHSRIWDASPLPLAEATGAGWKVSLPAGVSRQIWFDFKPDTKSCPAGKYEGQVHVQVEGGPKLSFPLTLTVGNYRLPEHKDRKLAIGVWDYCDMGGGDGLVGMSARLGGSDNLQAIAKHVLESGINVPWARQAWTSRGTFPRPKPAAKGQKVAIPAGMPLGELVKLPYETPNGELFDASGNLTVEIDFTSFDEWIKLYPPSAVKYYAIYAEAYWDYGGAKGKDPQSAGFTAADKANNDECQRRLGVVMKKFAEHMRGKGVDPNKIVLLMVDEVRADSAARMAAFWASAIKQAVPEFKFIMDPTTTPPFYKDPGALEMLSLMDFIIPGTDYVYHWQGQPAVDFYDGWRQKGKTMGFYSCAQSPSEGEATNYFRAQQWGCWQISKGGPASWAGLWAYSDFRGMQPWNTLAGGARDRTWAIAYIDSKEVTDSKHWLAIFEGANDYAYLHLLQDRIAELEKSGEKSAEVAAAKKVLAETPDQVFDAAHWQNQVDACDVGRLKVLAALATLAPETQGH